jgi:hypothetical protein
MRIIVALVFLIALTSCSSTITVPKACHDIKSCSVYVRAKLMSNLETDDAFIGQTITIEFFLNDNADIIGYNVNKKSGLLKMDQAVIKAIEKSSPFSAIKVLPEDVFEEFKHIVLTVSPTID